jgi:polysaccharide biosynthesis protein PslH
MKRKALIVAPTYPFPIDGGNLVALHGYHMALRHSGFDDVHFLGFDDSGHPLASKFEREQLVIKPPKVTIAGALGFAVGRSILFSRYRSSAFSAELKKLCSDNRYEAVIFQHAYIGQFLSEVADLLPKSCIKVISSEVLESRAFRTKALLANNPLLRIAFNKEAAILDVAETSVFNTFDRVTFFSDEDRQHYLKFGGSSDARVVNLGIEVDRYPLLERSPEPSGPLRVAFFGAFSWFANTDALRYLLDDVWPVVEKTVPDVELVIAGREIPEWAFSRANARLKVVGRVDSIAQFLETVDVVLSPIRIGGGIRLKILESLAYGRKVLSTRVGMEGLDPRVLKFVQAVDTPGEYASALAALSADRALIAQSGRSAAALVREIYDARQLVALFKS